MSNFNFNDYTPLPPRQINAPHLPVMILGDISGSMEGLPIANLNRCINRFCNDVCKDPKAADIVDVCVMGFNHEVEMIQEWRAISDMRPVSLTASGGTDLSKGLKAAIKKLQERGHLYEDIGTEVKMPHLILITDGYGGDVTEVARLIKERTAAKKMQLWILAVKGYDQKTVAQLSDGKRVFELVDENGYDFTDFFDFMAVSIKAVSTSAPGERVRVANPLQKEGTNLKYPDVNAWLNGDDE